jgi:hypothetical protein
MRFARLEGLSGTDMLIRVDPPGRDYDISRECGSTWLLRVR